MTRRDIEELRDLMQSRCFKYGDFTLSSGLPSKYYYDGKRATLHPTSARLIGNVLVDVVLDSGAEAIGGLEIGSVPIAVAIGQAALERGRELPAFIVRKEPKPHGTRDLVAEAYVKEAEHLLTEGRQVAIVDDVITTGGSVEKAVHAVEELGCKVAIVIALLERHERGGDMLRGRDYNVFSVFNTNEEGHLDIDEQFVQRAEEAARARLLP